MKTFEIIKQVSEYLKTPNKEALELSLNNVHAKGIFSLVLNGTEFGRLTRVLFADNKLKPFTVQYHTHRYPIRITVIKGNITHHTAVEVDTKKLESVSISKYNYRSFLNGGNGLSYVDDVNIVCHDFKLPIGSVIEMTSKEFHTMSCSKGSIWIVEELGFETDCSQVLGVPFIADELYSKPEMFQVNDKCQLLQKELLNIISSYNSIIN